MKTPVSKISLQPNYLIVTPSNNQTPVSPSALRLLSVLRPLAELLRPRRDVLVLRPLSHPVHAALPLVEEAHHAAATGGFPPASFMQNPCFIIFWECLSLSGRKNGCVQWEQGTDFHSRWLHTLAQALFESQARRCGRQTTVTHPSKRSQLHWPFSLSQFQNAFLWQIESSSCLQTDFELLLLLPLEAASSRQSPLSLTSTTCRSYSAESGRTYSFFPLPPFTWRCLVLHSCIST